MKLDFNFFKPAEVELSSAKTGSIVRFVDSGNGAQSFAEAASNPDENFFVVFEQDEEDEKPLPQGDVRLVAVDGKHIFNRRGNRLVVVHAIKKLVGSVVAKRKTLSSLEQGVTILYGIGPKEFEKKAMNEKLQFLYIVTKDTPASANKIPVISYLGKKVRLDDDLLVHVFDGRTIINF